MERYRIKTEKEFIDEYGSAWRKKVLLTWNSPDMDYLFGRELTDVEAKNLMNNESDFWRISIDDYAISKSMIIKNRFVYRFKTLGEMKESLGDNWDEYDEFRWSSEMFHFFGVAIPKKCYDEIKKNTTGQYSGYWIWSAWLTCDDLEKDDSKYDEKVDSKIQSTHDNKESKERVEELRRQLQMVAGTDGTDWDELAKKVRGYENELKCLCEEYKIQDYKYLDIPLVIKLIVKNRIDNKKAFESYQYDIVDKMGEKMTDALDKELLQRMKESVINKVDTAMVDEMDKLMEKRIIEQTEDEEFLNVITGDDDMSEGKVTTVDAALQLGKKIWKKNAMINANAAKSAAKRKVGGIVNEKLVDMVMGNMNMPLWLKAIGGKKVIKPIVKILIANSGVLAMGFFNLQGYKSTKAEFVAEAMMEDGYDTLVDLVNADNISKIVDKVIESVPDNLLGEAGFGDKPNADE